MYSEKGARYTVDSLTCDSIARFLDSGAIILFETAVVFWNVANQWPVFIPSHDITHIPFFAAAPLFLSPVQVGVTFQNESVRKICFFRILTFFPWPE